MNGPITGGFELLRHLAGRGDSVRFGLRHNHWNQSTELVGQRDVSEVNAVGPRPADRLVRVVSDDADGTQRKCGSGLKQV